MEMNYKDFSKQLKNLQNSKENTTSLYSYKKFIDVIRKDLAELRKEELDRAIDNNSLQKEGVVIIFKRANG